MEPLFNCNKEFFTNSLRIFLSVRETSTGNSKVLPCPATSGTGAEQAGSLSDCGQTFTKPTHLCWFNTGTEDDEG